MYCSDSFLLLILVLVSRMKNVHVHRRLDYLIQSLRFDRKSWFPRFAVSYKDKRFLVETVITILSSFPLSFKNYFQPELNNRLEQNLISFLCFMPASQNNYSNLPIQNLPLVYEINASVSYFIHFIHLSIHSCFMVYKKITGAMFLSPPCEPCFSVHVSNVVHSSLHH